MQGFTTDNLRTVINYLFCDVLIHIVKFAALPLLLVFFFNLHKI